jgi:hypothetical protein
VGRQQLADAHEQLQQTRDQLKLGIQEFKMMSRR